jgi:predicted glutamine amidotransferase
MGRSKTPLYAHQKENKESNQQKPSQKTNSIFVSTEPTTFEQLHHHCQPQTQTHICSI